MLGGNMKEDGKGREIGGYIERNILLFASIYLFDLGNVV
jgi:hypothetical protein